MLNFSKNKKVQKIYKDFQELDNLKDENGIPFCQSCERKDFCCHDGNVTSVVFIHPYEKEFIDKETKKKIKTISILDKETKTKVEIIRGTLKYKCPFFNKGQCQIYKTVPICCRLYPYAIAYEENNLLKGFYLERHEKCPIKVGEKDIEKMKKLCLELIEALPMDYWFLFGQVDSALFGDERNPRESYEKVALLKEVK